MNGTPATPFASPDREIIRYLLGEMAEAEQDAFEARYFRDDALFAQVALLREELADRYVRRQLSAAEKESYEKHLLHTPAHHEELAFAETLRQVLAESTAPQPQRFWLMRPVTLPRWSLAVATVLWLSLLGGFWWLWRGQQRLQTETLALRAAQTEAAARERALQEQLAALRTTASPAPSFTPLPVNENYVAMLLKPINDSRGTVAGETEKILPAHTQRLKLTLPLDFAPQAQSVSATLQNMDKKIRLTLTRLPFRCNGASGCQAFFEAKIPALKPGEYLVELTAVDESDQQSAMVEYRFKLIAPP
ncbi:MAG: hypothetical protein HOP19_28780 [Acidobacteria bacterium]|nr:hypothetical protein [Acidobacteriota bacterium]